MAMRASELSKRPVVGIASALSNAGGAVGAGLEFASQRNVPNPFETFGRVFQNVIPRKATEALVWGSRDVEEAGQKAVQKMGEKISATTDRIDQILEESGMVNQDVVNHPEIMATPDYWLQTIPNFVTQIGLMYLASAAGGPIAAGMVGGLQEAGPMYKDMLKQGIPEPEAAAKATAFFGVVSLLNKIGFESLTKNAGSGLRRIFNKVASSGVETITEMAEEPSEQMIRDAEKLVGTKAEAREFATNLQNSLVQMWNVAPQTFVGSLIVGGGGETAQPQQADQPNLNVPTQQPQATTETISTPEQLGPATIAGVGTTLPTEQQTSGQQTAAQPRVEERAADPIIATPETMTAQEYIDSKWEEYGGKEGNEDFAPDQEAMWKTEHKKAVEDAVRNGKRPSDDVLDEIPEGQRWQLQRTNQEVLSDYIPPEFRDWKKTYRQFLEMNRDAAITSQTIKGWHRNVIERAISEGKSVPDNVLKDYPELSAIEQAAPQATEQALEAPPSEPAAVTPEGVSAAPVPAETQARPQEQAKPEEKEPEQPRIMPLKRKDGSYRKGLYISFARNGKPYSKPVKVQILNEIDDKTASVKYSPPGQTKAITEVIDRSRITESVRESRKREVGKQLASVPVEERKAVQKSAKEFDDLLMSNQPFISFNEMTRIESQPGQRGYNFEASKVQRSARELAARELDIKDQDMGDPRVRAKYLPELKAYISEKRAESRKPNIDRAIQEIKNGEDEVTMPSEFLDDDSFIYKDGEWYKAKALDNGDVELTDGKTITVEAYSTVDVAGIVAPEETEAYAKVEAEYKAQLREEKAAEPKAEGIKPPQKEMFGQDEGGFSLVSEKGIDQERVAKEKKAKEEAAAKAEKQQTSFLDDIISEARSEIKTLKSSKTMGMNKPVGIAANYVVIGAAKVAKGVTEFTKWSAEMISEIGEEIRPYLRKIYDMSINVAKNKSIKSYDDMAKAAQAEAKELESAFSNTTQDVPTETKTDEGNFAVRLVSDESTIDAALKAGIQVEYDVRTNKESVEKALAIIEEEGTIDKARNRILQDNKIDPEVRVTAAQIIGRRIDVEQSVLRANGNEILANAKLQDAIDFFDSINEIVRSAGRTIQVMSMWDNMSPAGTLMAAQKAIHKEQERQGKPGSTETQGVLDGIEEIKNENKPNGGEVGSGAAERVKPKTRKTIEDYVKKGTMSMWERYRDASAKKLAKRAEIAKLPPPVQQLVNRISNQIRSKMKEGTKKQPSRDAVTILKEAIANRDKYAQIVDAWYAEAMSQAGNDAEIKAQIESVYAALSSDPVPANKRTLQEAVSQVMRELGVVLEEEIRKPYKSQIEFINALSSKIQEELGIDLETSEDIAGSIVGEVMDRMTAQINRNKQRIIDRAGSEKVKRAVKDEWQQILDLSNMGILTNESVYNAIAEKLGLPGFSLALADRISSLARQAQEAPEGIPRQKLREEAQRIMRKAIGVKMSDVLFGIYYSNMVSGYSTHLVNIVNNSLTRRALESVMVLSHPMDAAQTVRDINDGYKAGWSKGLVDAMIGLKTGFFRNRITTDPKFEMRASLEDIDFGTTGGVPIRGDAMGQRFGKLMEKAGFKPLNLVKYTMRGLQAEDAVANMKATEARVRVLASRQAKTPAERTKLIADDAVIKESALEQAHHEGYTGREAQQRANQIVEMMRNSDIQALAEAYGKYATFQNPLRRTLLGTMAKKINRASTSVVTIKLPNGRLYDVPVGAILKAKFVPFTTIVANVGDMAIDFSPLGFIRLGIEKAKSQEPGRALAEIPLTDRERVVQATLGTATSVAGFHILMALASLVMGDDDEPNLEFIGPGPKWSDRGLDAWARSGRKQYSVYIKGVGSIPFGETPLSVPLSLTGGYMDAVKYYGVKPEDMKTRLGYAAFFAMGAWKNNGFLGGLIKNIAIFGDASDPKQVAKALKKDASMTASNIFSNRMAAQIQKVLNPTVYDDTTMMQVMFRDVPFVNSLTGRPAIGYDGKAKRYEGNFLERTLYRFWTPANEDPALVYAGKHDAFKLFNPSDIPDQMPKEKYYDFEKAWRMRFHEKMLSEIGNGKKDINEDLRKWNSMIKAQEKEMILQRTDENTLTKMEATTMLYLYQNGDAKIRKEIGWSRISDKWDNYRRKNRSMEKSKIEPITPFQRAKYKYAAELHKELQREHDKEMQRKM